MFWYNRGIFILVFMDQKFLRETVQKNIWIMIMVMCVSIIMIFVPQLYKRYIADVYTVGNTFDVCASGCDFTTITDALATSTLVSGDTIIVSSTYSAAGETFPLYFPTFPLTLDCQNSGAVIGTVGDQKSISFKAGSIIQNCSFENVLIQDGGADAPGATISGNTFSTSTHSEISFTDGSSGSYVTGNTGLAGVSAGASNMSITDNTFQVYVTSTNGTYGINGGNGGHTISGNTFESYSTDYVPLLKFEGGISDSTIQNNTIEYKVSPTYSEYGLKPVWLKASTSTVFSGNYIIMPATTQTGVLVSIGSGSPGSINSLTITNNTFVFTEDDDNSNDLSAIGIQRASSGSDTVTIGYNIFVNKSANAEGKGIMLSSGSTSSIAVTEAYNGFYNLAINYLDNDTDYSFPLAASSKTTNPYFMTDDADMSNDYQLAPFSPYLDVDSTTDIGAYSAPRGTSFIIDDDGTIDYSYVHATSTSILNSILRTGDNITLAAGSYDPILVSSSTLLASGVTITGVGVSTIINGSASASALTLNGIEDSTFSNFVVENASSSEIMYTVDVQSFSYDGKNYNQIYGDTGIYILYGTGSSEHGPTQLLDVTADDTDITSYVGSTPESFSLALVDCSSIGIISTMYVRDDITRSAAESLFSSLGCVTPFDYWAEDILLYDNGVYIFNDPEGGLEPTGTGTSLNITKNTLSYEHGIKLDDSSGNTFSSVTSTGNTYGIYFTGTSANNNFNDSAIQNSTTYDVLSDSSQNNNIKNSNFDRSKVSITGTGDVNVYYKVRGQVSNILGSGIGGTGLTFTSFDTSQTASLTADSTGTSTYSAYLLSHVMDSTSTSTSNGGYNPYTISATATSTYVASSATFTLSAANQSAALTMLSMPAAPSGLAISGGIGDPPTSSMALTWTDNGSGVAQEDSFLLDYIEVGGSFPGTTSTLDQDSTSVTVVDLSPNTQYQFRIASVNGAGISSYSTSSAQYTAAETPMDVVGSANGQTSIIVSWSANNNAVGTVYELFNVTASTTIATTTGISYTVNSLTANTPYQFKVRAQYRGDNSTWTDWSNTSVAVSTASASTGGSSGSSPPPPPVAPTTIAPVDKKLILNVGTPASLFIGNSVHTVTLNSIGANGAVTLVIESDPIEVTLLPGEERLVDTNKDGEKDLFVRYNSLNGTKADLTLSAIEYLEFSINHALSETDSREVTLYFNSPYSIMMLVSNHPNFDGASYENYVSSKSWTLTAGEGTKTVYVKFRTAQGATKVVSDTIVYKAPMAQEDVVDNTNDNSGEPMPETCPLVFGSAYRYPGNPGIAYITSTCTKRWFSNSTLFFSYYSSYSDAQLTTKTILDSIPLDTKTFMPWGPRYNPQYGALVKTVQEPKVYMLLGGKKSWIKTQDIFEALGYEWNWIEDVDNALLEKYPDAGEITETNYHPNYTLIKYVHSPKVYRLEPDHLDSGRQVKRWIINEVAFREFGFRWDRIITVPDQEQYADGSTLD